MRIHRRGREAAETAEMRDMPSRASGFRSRFSPLRPLRPPLPCGELGYLHRGLSLIEVLVALLLLALCFSPILDLLGHSRRITSIASHQVVASSEAQTILDALTALEPADLPAGAAAAGGVVLLSDKSGGLAGGTPRWQEVVKFFGERKPDKMERSVESVAMGPDRILVRVTVKYTRLSIAQDGGREFTMVGLVVRRS